MMEPDHSGKRKAEEGAEGQPPGKTAPAKVAFRGLVVCQRVSKQTLQSRPCITLATNNSIQVPGAFNKVSASILSARSDATTERDSDTSVDDIIRLLLKNGFIGGEEGDDPLDVVQGQNINPHNQMVKHLYGSSSEKLEEEKQWFESKPGMGFYFLCHQVGDDYHYVGVARIGGIDFVFRGDPNSKIGVMENSADVLFSPEGREILLTWLSEPFQAGDVSWPNCEYYPFLVAPKRTLRQPLDWNTFTFEEIKGLYQGILQVRKDRKVGKNQHFAMQVVMYEGFAGDHFEMLNVPH